MPTPLEGFKTRQVLGKDASQEEIDKKTGHLTRCVCLDCLSQFFLDLGDGEDTDSPVEDKEQEGEEVFGSGKCPECGSIHVYTVEEMVGMLCPECRRGIIINVWTGSIS